MSGFNSTSKTRNNKESISILACDDNNLIRKALEAFLSIFPSYKVVGDGKAAITEALTGHYQLVIVDINMPEIDGYEVAKQIKKYATENNKKILVYAHTADNEGDYKDDSDFDGLILKPLDIEIVKGIIENFWNIKH